MRKPQAPAHQSQQYQHQTNNLARYINQGIALINQHRFEEALASYDHALKIQPQHADALCNRGSALIGLNRIQDALDSYEQALIIQPHHMQALSNRGNILLALGRFGEALESYDRALAIQPNYADALSNRGAVLLKLNRFEEALVSLTQALALQPDYAEAHWNEAICRLSIGDFALGWQKFEWRWKKKKYAKPPAFPQPLWLGKESLRNKTILLYAEQGLGDTIQFCRYAQQIASLGATVILVVQPTLKTLLRNLAGISRVIVAQDEALPPFDYHCPLLSLPLACNTTLHSIPFSANAAEKQRAFSMGNLLVSAKHFLSSPKNTTSASAKNHYLSADAVHKAIWKNKLGNKTLPRIGLAWSGNPEHANDSHRSIPLINLMEIIDVHNKIQAQFYCLQKECRANDQALIDQHNNQQNDQQNNIVFVGDDLKDFSDTAALIDAMDLVITVDTSIAHLAGAMGKPVWILLPFNPDWRWLTNRNDSPWYPSARLFRQPAIGDWGSVMHTVKQALLSLLSTPNTTNITNTTSTTNHSK